MLYIHNIGLLDGLFYILYKRTLRKDGIGGMFLKRLLGDLSSKELGIGISIYSGKQLGSLGIRAEHLSRSFHHIAELLIFLEIFILLVLESRCFFLQEVLDLVYDFKRGNVPQGLFRSQDGSNFLQFRFMNFKYKWGMCN